MFQDINDHYYHEDNLLHSAMNLFAAGTDTTADTLQWGLLYIAKYPHIQGAETHRADFSRSHLAELPRFSAPPIRSGPGGAQQGGGKPPGAGRRQEEPAVRRSRHPRDSETGQHRPLESSSQNQPRHHLPGILHRKGSPQVARAYVAAVSFRGSICPQGTMVIPLLTSVLYDENEWETPHTFNPAHFLDGEGRFVRRDAFMPFSAGRPVSLRPASGSCSD